MGEQGKWRIAQGTPCTIETPHGRVSVSWSSSDGSRDKLAEETALHIVACVNALDGIRNPAAIGRVVDAVRVVLAADDMYMGDGAPTLHELREALAELDREPADAN